MPIPLIPVVIGLASLATGAIGAKKAYDASENFSKARRDVEDAQADFQRACSDVEQLRDKVADELAALGQVRLQVSAKSLTTLIELVRQVHGADEVAPIQLDGTDIQVTPPSMQVVEAQAYEAIDFLAHGVKAMGAGALVGVGAGQAVATLGAASTGTAISTLSGAAATNATLAWLGGGSLATGGLGVAGGTAVLGGAISGPILFVMGYMAAGKSEEALTKAREQCADLAIAAEKVREAEEVLLAVDLRVREVAWVLSELDQRFKASARAVKRILVKARKAFVARYEAAGKEVPERMKNAKVNYSKLKPEEQSAYQLMVMIGSALHEVNQVKIFNGKGSLTRESAKVVKAHYALLEQL